MFEALPPSAYTVKVGRAPRSLARYSVPGPSEVRQLLRSLHEADAAAPEPASIEVATERSA